MTEESNSQEPGLVRKAVNFSKAVARHVVDGGRKVDDTLFQQRLEICRNCPSCDTDRMVCREKKCGCKLTLKARWRSDICPQNKWPTV